jgi:[ribosomal protein S18]-alanine N-acetyltransferase
VTGDGKNPGTRIVLRAARRDDLDPLFALDRVCFREGIAYSRSELLFFLTHPQSFSFVAEHENGRIAGFAIAKRGLRSGRSTGHIITIDVDPAFRREGVGRLLMTAMEEKLREAGAESIQLEVAVDNAAAEQFYLGHGYRPAGRIRGFYMGTLDALVMRKSIQPEPVSAE